MKKKTNIKKRKLKFFKLSILIFPFLLILAKLISIIIEKIDPTECIPEFCWSSSQFFFDISKLVLLILFIPYLLIYIIVLLKIYFKNKK